MESLGAILKEAREKQGIALKEVSIKTNMGMKYLTAIEEDRFETFPSETHVCGFLRNYAQFLGLEPEQLISIYKRALLQEAPTPIEELTAPDRREFNPKILAVSFSLLALFAGLFYILSSNTDTPADNREAETVERPVDPLANTNSSIHSRTFEAGDNYKFLYDGKETFVFIKEINPDSVQINLLNTIYTLKEGQKQIWDFSGNGFSDLSLKIDTISQESALLTFSHIKELMSTGRSAPDANTAADTSTAETVEGNIIVKSHTPVEMNLSIKASGLSMITIIKDDEQQAQHTLNEGDTLSVLAKNTLLIKATNPYNLALNLNNRNLQVVTGDPIAGFLFKWRRSTVDGMYHLEYERVQ